MSETNGYDDLASLLEGMTFDSTETSEPVAKKPETLHGAILGTPAYAIAEEYDGALGKLSDLNSENQKYEDEIKALNAELNRIRAEYALKLDEVENRKKAIESERFDLRRKIREAQREVERLHRLLDIAIAEEMRKHEFITAGLEFDKITAGLPWREFALQHQIDGAKVLANSKRGICGDGMGLGKTLTSLIYCDMLQAQKILIIVPDDVVSNFDKEIKRWAPHRNWLTLAHMPPAERNVMLKYMAQMEEFVCTITYSAWRKDKGLLVRLAELRLDTVIMDEAHNIKNCKTSAYQGCKSIVLAENSCPRCGDRLVEKQTGNGRYCIDQSMCKYDSFDWDNSRDENGEYYPAFASCSVKNVLPMTGTVILNKPQDLFALLSLVDPQNFTDERWFLSMYCQQDPYTQKWKFSSGGLPSLIKKLGSRYVARDRKSAGVVLPKQTIKVHEFTLDKDRYPKQAKVIEDLTKHAQIAVESAGTAIPMLYTITLILRKRQANVWPAGIEFKDVKGNVVFSVGDEVTESQKLDMLVDNTCSPDNEDCTEGMIPEMVAEGERVVVFSQFKGPLKELVARLNERGIRAVAYDGETNDKTAREIKEDFDRSVVGDGEYKYDVVCANFRKGGVGLNFTAATQTIILDEEWNPGKNEQAYGRTDRIGQTQESQVHILRMARTVDDWMAALNSEKAEMINGFESEAKLSDSILDALKNGEL